MINANYGAIDEFPTAQLDNGIIRLRNRQVLINQQRHRELLFCGKAAVRLGVTTIHAQDADIRLRIDRRIITCGAELFCANRCLIFRIKNQDNVVILQCLREIDDATVVSLERKLWCVCTRLEFWHRAGLAFCGAISSVVMRIWLVLAGCCLLLGCVGSRDGDVALVGNFSALRASVMLLAVESSPSEYGSASVVYSNARGSLLLSDEHVVTHARHIRVCNSVGRWLGQARVVARDHAHDAVLLWLPVPGLPAVPIGDSSRLAVGDAVAVAGYPIPDAFEEQHWRVSPTLAVGHVANLQVEQLVLDLPIIPGDSGAPIFDPATGVLIGVAEGRFEDEPAIGLATPINMLNPLIKRGLVAANAPAHAAN